MEPHGEYLLNTHLEALKKSDPHKNPAQHQQILEQFHTFLNHDERAPGPNKPFLSPRSLKLVAELQQAKKLPAYSHFNDSDAGTAPVHPTANLRWAKGAASLIIAAHLTNTKKQVLNELQKHGEEIATNPNPQLDEIHRRFDAIITPYHKLIDHFLPPQQAAKHHEELEKEGAHLLAQKKNELSQTAEQIGVDPQTTRNVISSVDEQTKQARRFATSEEYIQHRLKNYERWLSFQRTTGKIVGDSTVGAAILTFAPPVVIPFVVIGYLGHQLSTININLRKDRKEQQLRDRTHKFDTNLDRLSQEAFGTIPQKLSAHLQKLNFLPALSRSKSNDRQATDKSPRSQVPSFS